MTTIEKLYDASDDEPEECVNVMNDANTLQYESDEEKNDFQDNLFMMLNYSVTANFDQLAYSCCTINDKLNNLEMNCIDLLQPVPNIITLKRQLKQLNEIESNCI